MYVDYPLEWVIWNEKHWNLKCKQLTLAPTDLLKLSNPILQRVLPTTEIVTGIKYGK